MNWKNLLACIFTPTTGPHAGVYGTGVPVQDGLILTAHHVLAPPRRDRSRRIRVCWWYTSVESSRGFREVAGDDAEVIAWHSCELDAALLRYAHPEGCSTVRGWLWLRPRRPEAHTCWESEGFPRMATVDDQRAPGSFRGNVHSRADAESHFEVDVTTPPEREDDWGGASGMPIVVDGTIIGIAGQVPANVQNAKLQATPVWKLWQIPDFRALVESEVAARHRAVFVEKIVGYLAGSAELCTRLAEGLGGARQAALDLAQLARAGGADRAARTQAGETLCDVLPQADAANVFEAVFEAHREHPDDAAARELACLLAPALQPFQRTAWVLRERDQPSVALLEIPAGTHTMAEVLMAAAERRATLFRQRRSDADFPPGENWLPLTPNIEYGPEETGARVATAICHHLDQTYGGDFAAAVDEYVTTPGSPANLLALQAGEPLPGADARRRRVQQRLSLLRRLGEPCPYLAFFAPAEEEDLSILRNAAAQIKERYPEMIIFLLDPTHTEDDEEQLGTLQLMLQ